MSIYSPKTEIKIFDSFTNKLQSIKTYEKDKIKIYVCGPTVYDRPHLGNVRSIVIYDLFFRLFRQIFDNVIYVRNITDVDDKINLASKEQKISINTLTSKILEYFYHDIEMLNVLKPTFEPKVTENIDQIIILIQKLLDNNHAYISNNHVVFDVSSYKNYGALSKRNLNDLIAGSRVQIANYKKNPNDFVLWKPAGAEDDPSSIFQSPWGSGRPGWHIECSAMSYKYLGENFDIHGGGADLQFPHHENEIAQSCCANPNSRYSTYWIHNGFLTVNGEKMSKSLKNFITVNDLLTQGYEGVAIRLMLLSTHYRKPFDFNQKNLDDAVKTIKKFHEIILANKNQNIDFNNKKASNDLLNSLTEDLNISKAIAHLHNCYKKIKLGDNSLLQQFIYDLDFLGILNINYKI